MSVTPVFAVTWSTALGDFSDELAELIFCDEQSANAWIAGATGFDDWGYDLWDDHASFPVVSRFDGYDGSMTADDCGLLRETYTVVPDPDRDRLIADALARFP